MKNLHVYIVIGMLAILYSCSPSTEKGDLITIDVTKKYPQIELNLDDIADIKYVRLKEHPGVLVKSRALLFSDKYIIVRGENEELLIFDHEGNLSHSIFRVGSGPHEYLYASNLYLDEERGELLVHDCFIQKYFVYSLNGDFIREGKTGVENYLYGFNKDEFICYNKVTNRVDSDMTPYFSIISKKDWQVKKEIRLPVDEIRDLEVRKSVPGGGVFLYSPMHYPLVRSLDGFVLNDLASDTLYRYTSKEELLPLIVRKPSINSMGSPVYLRFGVETEKYIFLTVTSIDEGNSDDMFPSTELVYDKKNKTIHEYKVIFDDWLEMPVIFDAECINLSNTRADGAVTLGASGLVDYYKANRLKGRLKEIAAGMDEEDNHVIMLLKFR